MQDIQRWKFEYNFKKTKVVTFGKNYSDLTNTRFTFKGNVIDVVREWKYLGATVLSGKEFLCSCDAELCAFFRASNSVLNVDGKPSNEILMKILYTICVPKLLYACEVKDLANNEITRLNTAVNDAIRKIFSFSRWESTRELRSSYGYLSITETFQKRKSNFLRRIPSMGNSIVRKIVALSP